MELNFDNSDSYKPGDILISAVLIEKRLDELAAIIARDYQKKESVIIVGLLTGAAWFTADLFTRLHTNGLTNIELSFMKVSSYPTGTNAVHEPRIEFDVSINPQKKDILLVDDIADTGKSLSVVEKLFQSKDAKSIKSVVLLDKPSRREVKYVPEYVGFRIPNIWVQGRGMDSAGFGRGDPNIIKGPYNYK